MKKLSDLELCKVIADLEFKGDINKKLVQDRNKLLLLSEVGDIMFEGDDIDYPLEYNPITDHALNCQLRDKHEVMISYPGQDEDGYAVICKDNGVGRTCFTQDFEAKEGVNRAVLEVILRAAGVNSND